MPKLLAVGALKLVVGKKGYQGYDCVLVIVVIGLVYTRRVWSWKVEHPFLIRMI